MVLVKENKPIPINRNSPVIRLLIDSATVIHVGDKPIFGVDVTISEKLKSLAGNIILPGVILGWVNYLEISKFACFTVDNHYVEANKFLYTTQNQIVLSKAIKIHEVNEDMANSKYICSFSLVS
jgi:hypothetical protein